MRAYTGIILSIVSLPPLVYLGNPAVALLTGMVFTLTLNRSLVEDASRYSRYFLQTAIVLLGIKLNIVELWRISADYTLAISLYVVVALATGWLIGRLLKIEQVSTILIAAGTAICGGTTIATLSPILRARVEQTGAALAIIFLLNAVALMVFPYVGHQLQMSQEQFGVWAAIAIHDTSSVVATAQIYGEEAARIATTVKLGRTLWLIPLVLATSLWVQTSDAKMRIPMFIIFFIMASAIGSLLPVPDMVVLGAAWLSKALLVTALYLIGTEISRSTLKELKGRILIQALILWSLVVPLTLVAVLSWVA